MKKRMKMAAVSITVTCALIAGTVATAQADTPPSAASELVQTAQTQTGTLDAGTAESVVEAVEALAAVDGIADNVADTTTVEPDGSAVTSTNGMTIEVPSSGDQPVAVTTPTGTVTIDLPVPAGTDSVVVGGVSVYPTEHGAITQHVAESGGTQTSFVLNGPSAPTDYPVQIKANGDGALKLEADGSITILNPDGTISSTLAVPWARDANEAAVPTWYTVEDNTVTQHIDTSSVTSWPVVADPFWNVFGNYLRCVLGIGVPAGVAGLFVAYVGYTGLQLMAMNYAARFVPGPGWVMNIVRPYAGWVWNGCRQFVRS